jgi:signal transduction histidine kinase
MNPLRSVGARLGLALAVVVAVALAIVYATLVPALERRLTNAALAHLTDSADKLAPNYRPFNPDWASTESFLVDARVVVFRPLSTQPPALQVFQDSRNGANSSDVENDPLALAVVRTERARRGTVERGEQLYAEVARPLGSSGDVLLLSASLQSSLADVALIRRRLLWAGLFALLGSVLLGTTAASAFARRIKRLERAADRIAGGDFSERVFDDARDELGELARAFDRMRGRLAQLDDARRAFIANASHELRTPIFSLGGFLELLQDEDLDEPTRAEFLATMREQVERLTKLATDLLDLSRLDAGRLRVELEPVSLVETAETLAAEFQAIAGEHPLVVELEARGDAEAEADFERVLQIGRVLVENALRHTPPGTPVWIVVRDPAELAVEDSGPGIPVADAERVFDRFTRLEGSRASGSGLGLAIARELAALMHGELRLESRPGRTSFRLALPAVAASISRENEPTGVL